MKYFHLLKDGLESAFRDIELSECLWFVCACSGFPWRKSEIFEALGCHFQAWRWSAHIFCEILTCVQLDRKSPCLMFHLLNLWNSDHFLLFSLCTHMLALPWHGTRMNVLKLKWPLEITPTLWSTSECTYILCHFCLVLGNKNKLNTFLRALRMLSSWVRNFHIRPGEAALKWPSGCELIFKWDQTNSQSIITTCLIVS